MAHLLPDEDARFLPRPSVLALLAVGELLFVGTFLAVAAPLVVSLAWGTALTLLFAVVFAPDLDETASGG